MTKKIRKGFACVLSLCMVMALLPFSALAIDEDAGTFSDYSIAAGSITGTTAITINDTVGEDDSLVYTIGSAEVTGLTTDSTVSDYSAFTSGGNIAVTEGQYVTVYEIITATEAVVKYVSLEITADNIASDYTLSIGTASTGGAGYTRDITIGGTKSDNLAGDYLVVQFTSGSGTSAKVSVVIIELTGSDKTVTVSYQTSGTAIATWLTNGIPDLTASTLDVEEYATATAN